MEYMVFFVLAGLSAAFGAIAALAVSVYELWSMNELDWHEFKMKVERLREHSRAA